MTSRPLPPGTADRWAGGVQGEQTGLSLIRRGPWDFIVRPHPDQVGRPCFMVSFRSHNICGVCKNLCIAEGGMCDTTKSFVLAAEGQIRRDCSAVPNAVRWVGLFTSSFCSHRQLLEMRACTPIHSRRTHRPRGTLPAFHILKLFECVGPVSLPRVSTVPTPRHALAAAVGVHGSCSPFRERRMYRSRGTPFVSHNLPPLECEGTVPPSAGAYSTDSVGRSFSRWVNARGLYLLPRVSSSPTPWNARSLS